MKFAFATAILKIETLRMRRRFARVSVDCVCGRSLFAKRCFLETIFSPEGDTLKSYKSKRTDLFDYSQILTVASFAYKQQNRVSQFFISKYLFFKSDFCTINSHFLNPISKMFCNFTLKLNMANRRHVFLALWPRKRRNTLNKRKTKFALTGNAQNVI